MAFAKDTGLFDLNQGVRRRCKMGLTERRAVQTLKDDDFKQFVEQVKWICGFEVAIEMDWASLENDDDCLWIVQNKKHQEYMFRRLQNALAHICSDHTGKSALSEKLKKIVLINASGDLGFEAGTFTLRTSLIGNGNWGEEQIREFIKRQL